MGIHLEYIMFFAFRYALGRRSFAPFMVQDYIRSVIKEVSTATLEKIAEEISDAERESNLGDEEIDRPIWLEFLVTIEDEIEERRLNG